MNIITERMKRSPLATFGCLLFIGMLILFYSFNKTSITEETNSFYLESDIEDGVAEVITEEVAVDSSPQLLQELIYVDVKGAVIEPNIYKVDPDNRVNDVIEMAGGFSNEADRTAVNLAARVKDEMVIYVPAIGEETDVSFPLSTTGGNENSGKININNATNEQLQQLPGIGPAKAAAIIKYREENGPFKNSNDLLNISGIGEKSLDKLADLITVNFILSIYELTSTK